MPGWVALVVAVVAFSVVQFRAFHRVRLARDELLSQQSPYGRIPGLVNELSGGSYWPDRRAVRLQPDEDGLVARVVLSPRNPHAEAQLDSNLMEALKKSLVDSPLERWSQTQTDAAPPWTIQSPSTNSLTTVARSPLLHTLGPATLSCYCQFEVPTGLHSPRAVLIIDVVVLAQPSGDADDRFRFSRLDVYELCHVLIGTATDVVAPEVFPAVSAQQKRFSVWRQQPPVGPSVYLVVNGQKNLSDFIDLADLQRVLGSSPSDVNSMAAIETPRHQRLDSFSSRDKLVKDGLKRTLRANEFLQAETVIDSLALTPSIQGALNAARRKHG